MADSRCRLTACCGCYSLKTGTIFSGIMCIILAILDIVLIYTVNVQWKTIIIDVDPVIARIAYTINLVMTIILSIIMVVGALRKSTIMMLPWVVLGILLLVGLLVSVLYTSISLFLNEDEVNHVLYGVFILLFGLIALVICTYFWFVVYSYFQQLRLEKNSLKIGPYGRPYSYQRP